MSIRRDSSQIAAIDTEAVRPELAELDALPVADLVALMTAEPGRACDAVVSATGQIAVAVEAVADRLSRGGRLIYAGAGTAGRLGVLDAAEAGPTFNAPRGLVVAVVAGGLEAMLEPKEGAEDDAEAGAAELRALACSREDAVVGVSASGRTPFVTGAITYARGAGALTVGIVCSRDSVIATEAELAVELLVGGELIAGSTRLNAGTAQKITLNILSTAVMIQLGKTYGNLMVDVRPTNGKLRDRALRIVVAVAKASPEDAREALEATGWRTKLACVVAATGKTVDESIALLAASGDRLRVALESVSADRSRPATSSVQRSGSRRGLGVSAFLQNGRLVPGDITVADGRVEALGLTRGGHGIALPGFVDLQVNGYAGVDALGAGVEGFVEMSRALARDGVLAFQPTLISSDIAITRAAQHIAELARAHPDGARVLGIHLEGPFLSPMRAGTHPLERLVGPDVELLRSLLDAGPVTMVTLAPELPGAISLIEECVRRSIAVSFGHSDANAAEALRGFDAGGSAVTHIFNAMAPISARSPGLAGAALADPRVTVQVIADGVHVADDLLRIILSSARGRWSLVSDATAASGLGDGKMLLGEVPVFAEGGVVRRGDGTIAGSGATLLDGVHHLAELGAPLGDVLAAVSERPGRLLGRDDVGRITIGSRADLVVLTDDLRLQDVLLEGRSLR